jgi:hypothetical protein
MSQFIAFSDHNYLVELFILWNCRIFGITFGGLVLTKTGECVVNKKLKIFGNIITILISIYFLISMSLSLNQDYSTTELYDSGFRIIYYISHFWIQLNTIFLIYNLFYCQYRGFDLCKVWLSFHLKSLKNKIVIISILILNYLSIIIFMLLLCQIKTNSGLKLFVFNLIMSIFYLTGQSTIKTITWCKFFNA